MMPRLPLHVGSFKRMEQGAILSYLPSIVGEPRAFTAAMGSAVMSMVDLLLPSHFLFFCLAFFVYFERSCDRINGGRKHFQSDGVCPW